MLNRKSIGKAFISVLIRALFLRYTIMLQEEFKPIDVLFSWNKDVEEDAEVSMSIQNKLVQKWEK